MLVSIGCFCTGFHKSYLFEGVVENNVGSLCRSSGDWFV